MTLSTRKHLYKIPPPLPFVFEVFVLAFLFFFSRHRLLCATLSSVLFAVTHYMGKLTNVKAQRRTSLLNVSAEQKKIAVLFKKPPSLLVPLHFSHVLLSSHSC